MSTPRFIGDLHMGHRNIYKYRGVFISTEHNDLYWMYVISEMHTKRDSFIVTGDALFDKKYLPFIKELPGTKILVPGNHCTENMSMKDLCNAFDEVHALWKYKEFWVSHAPIHTDELRGKKNIHGHVHTESIMDARYLNTSADSSFSRFLPRTLHEIREAYSHMESTGEIYGGLSGKEALDAIYADPISRRAYERSLQDAKKIIVYT